MEQLLIHVFGDYFLQSDYMALNKNKNSYICAAHCFLYTVPFLLLTHDPIALFLIFLTHFLEDRWSTIRYLIWFKNHLNPLFQYPPFKYCSTTGFYDDWNSENKPSRPKFITTWLYIICDNSFHLACNFLILKYLCGQ